MHQVNDLNDHNTIESWSNHKNIYNLVQFGVAGDKIDIFVGITSFFGCNTLTVEIFNILIRWAS